MIRAGLVSITFRHLSPEEVLGLATQASLEAIEWGGDIHVPHGDKMQARRVGQQTVAHGLAASAYGSYYRVGHPQSALDATQTPVPFEAIVETAAELGAPKIRVWAGNQGTDEASPAYFEQVVQDSLRIAEIGQSANIQIAYEYHGNTLTDTDIAARRLLEAVTPLPEGSSAPTHTNPKTLPEAPPPVNKIAASQPTILSYWQPRKMGTLENDLAGIRAVRPWLSDIHVFSWHPKTGERLPLDQRADDWQSYLEQLQQIPNDRFALLEFVQDNEPEHFLRDAQVLKQWLEE